MPKNFDPAIKEWTVPMVLKQLPEHGSISRACAAVGAHRGLGKESLRIWVRKAHIDADERDGVAASEDEEIKRLRAENRRLREVAGRAAGFEVPMPLNPSSDRDRRETRWREAPPTLQPRGQANHSALGRHGLFGAEGEAVCMSSVGMPPCGASSVGFGHAEGMSGS